MPHDNACMFGWPDHKRVRSAYVALEASLKAKGLVPGTRKFHDVFSRKWSKQCAHMGW